MTTTNNQASIPNLIIVAYTNYFSPIRYSMNQAWC
uniref:Uncharacterized protein n=1 Tax=Rhizophora mucronata TaxID=61149 RepID=A0A2P2Q4F0_RHIMU